MSLSNTTLDVSHLVVDLPNEPQPHIPCDNCGFSFRGDSRMFTTVHDDVVQRPILCEMCVDALFGDHNAGPPTPTQAALQAFDARYTGRTVAAYFDPQNEALTDLTV